MDFTGGRNFSSANMSVASLLSPPDMDKSKPYAGDSSSTKMSSSHAGIQPLATPPISPEEDLISDISTRPDDTEMGPDPPLYPSSHNTGVSPSTPLFCSSLDVTATIEHHAAEFNLNTPTVKGPSLDEYGLVSQVLQLVKKNPKQYRQREREYMSMYTFAPARVVKRAAPRLRHIAAAKLPTTPKTKIASSVSRPKARPRAQSTTKRTPKPTGSFTSEHVASRAKSTSNKVSGKTWRDWPDYSPSFEKRPPTKMVSFVPPSHNYHMDHSKDPDLQYLHPEEAAVASKMRLTCGGYLEVKRRIFIGKIQKMQDQPGTEFKKTHAQTAANIDVNKASGLWTVFNELHWFDNELFQEHLHKNMPSLAKK